MDIQEWIDNESEEHKNSNEKKDIFDTPFNLETVKSFFRFTGGSLFYCISAVFIAYGIVNLMGDVLSSEVPFRKALPCIITLHAYELALLAVLMLIVWRKVVDDAISLIIFIALFLIGTSMALGTVADKDISLCTWIAIIGIVLAFGKFFAMWRFVGIKFKILSVIGLGIIISYNYLSPILLAKSMADNPAQVADRRNLWLLLEVVMLAGSCFVLFEAIKSKVPEKTQGQEKIPFLRQPLMVYIFALILIVASGVHQYATSYTFALERTIGDYLPIVLIASLLLIEIIRYLDEKFGFAAIFFACIPFVAIVFAILQKSVIASWGFGIELLFYPPVIMALSGLAIAALALYHKWYKLLYATIPYILGTMLTIGFSPAEPHDLNIYAVVVFVIIGLLLYGIITRNQYALFSVVVILSVCLLKWKGLEEFASGYGLNSGGLLLGLYGLGVTILYFIFGINLNKTIKVLGTLCIAGFLFDYLPAYAHWKYIIVSMVTIFLMAGFWFRTKEILLISILWIPTGLRLYMLAKQIAQWRYVIVGFFLLIAGTVFSLLKHTSKDLPDAKEPENV
ncbi:MAG: hypothetical protein JXA96_02370 [Sedimentisphaerales bacterium]|nr:hypothetical protein [Sedimentisphaerales bacterium]